MFRRYRVTGEPSIYGQKGKRYAKLNSFTGKGVNTLMLSNFMKV
jgi:hypothetical protein